MLCRQLAPALENTVRMESSGKQLMKRGEGQVVMPQPDTKHDYGPQSNIFKPHFFLNDRQIH